MNVLPREFWGIGTEEPIKQLETRSKGLTTEEAKERLSKLAPNLVKPHPLLDDSQRSCENLFCPSRPVCHRFESLLAFLVVLFIWLFLWEIGGQNIPNDSADMEEDIHIKFKTIPPPIWT